MVKEGRAPGVGALNPVLSHFHWVGICLVRLAGLIIKDALIKYGHQRAKPSGAVFFSKISCNRIYMFKVASGVE